MQKPLKVKGNAAITCDWHIPCHHRGLLKLLMKKSKELSLKKLIIGADFFNFDTFSPFLRKAMNAPIDRELKEVYKVASLLESQFSDIYLSTGNHEKWLLEKMGFSLPMETIFKMFWTPKNARWHISDLDYILLTHKREKWRIGHPREYSRIPLSKARKFAEKYQCNIINAHGHFFSRGRDKTGKHVIYDGGGMFDPAKLEYTNNTNSYPYQTPGFITLKNGREDQWEIKDVS